MDLILEVFFAFLATITFSIMFNTPKKEIIYCGIIGSIGWFFYSICLMNGGASLINNFIGTFFIAYLSKIFSRARRNPISVFLIPGIITLVPGGTIYNTALNVIMADNTKALFYGVETVKIACAIALGIIVALAMPSFIKNKAKAQ